MESDAAPLVWRRDAWIAGSGVDILRRALAAANSLPVEVSTRRHLQQSIYAHEVDARAVRTILGVLYRRLCYFEPSATHGDAIATMTNIRLIFHTLPTHVGIAALRAVANGWITSRRLSHIAERCQLRCYAVEVDTVVHHFGCPCFLEAVRGSGHDAPTCAADGFGRDVMMSRFGDKAQIQRNAMWNYQLNRIYNQARYAPHAYSAEDFALAMRGQVRSLATWPPRAATLLGIA